MRFATKISFAFTTFILAFTITSRAQNKADAIAQHFQSLSRNSLFNGNILVAEKGKVLYQQSFGYADYTSKKRNTASTSFPVASVTKTMVSTAVLQLMEKGKLQLEDAYVKYFPSFPYPHTTIKELMSHTSRIPSSAFYRFLDSLQTNKDTVFTNADVMAALIQMHQPLTGAAKPIGDRSVFAYSNLNYYLLANLIEKLSGLTYREYIRKNIFVPAGMKNSSFTEFYFAADKNAATEHRYPFFYSETPERVDTLSSFQKVFKVYNLKGHGDVVSTIGDLLKYQDALEKNILVKETTLRLAYTPVVYGNNNTSGYGLGWSILHDSTKGKVVMHHGGGIGMEVMFVRNLTTKQSVILFDNFKNPAFPIAMNVVKMLNGESVPLAKKSVAKLYGGAVAKGDFEAARKLLNKSTLDSANYYLSEDEINTMGYQFMRIGEDQKALEVLKTNLELFPGGWNAYDSYGEILLKFGRKEEAIKMYRKSLELNPENESGKKVLENLLK